MRATRPTEPAAAIDPRSWTAPRPSGLRRRVPIVAWLPAYDRRLLRFDVAPTLLTLLGQPVPDGLAGRSIV